MRIRSIATVILTVALLISILSSVRGPVQAAGPSVGSMSIKVTTFMDPVYDVFWSGSSRVVVAVNGTLQIQSQTQIELVSSFRPSQLNASAIVNGTTIAILPSVSAGRYASHFAIDFQLPANTTEVSVNMTGTQAGNGFLWRYITNVPSVVLQSSAAIAQHYSTLVILPQGTLLSGIFHINGTQLPQSISKLVSTAGGSQVYSVPLNVGTVLLQSALFVPGSIAISAIAVVVFALAALNVFAFGKVYLGRVRSWFSKNGLLPLKGPTTISSRTISIGSLVKRIFQPRKLLALFLACAVLMVSLGAISGPDPRVHAYVVAAPVNVGPIQRGLASFEPNLFVLTPSQDYSDFEVMSSVADFNIAVISNYPSISLPTISGFIVRGLANVPVIVMDNQTNSVLKEQINALYGNKIITVQNAANLSPGEKQQIASVLDANARVRLLGLSLSTEGFKAVLVVEAILSFVLIFLGWAYLGSLASGARLRSNFSQLATVLSSGVFIFLFSEIIYVTTSILLAYPLSLHAVISGATGVTAVSFIGFGGGSTPRLAAGVVGVFLGMGLTEGAPKIEKTELAIILGVGLFILSDPLFLGQFAYTGLLLFVGNFSFGSAYVSSQSLKGFVYGIGQALGGSVNSTYLLSAGKMLYFAGLIPFAYLGRMGRTTTVLAALFSALLLGDGGVRVGEMTPEKSVIAVVPGLLVGFAFLVIFLGLASGENYLRRTRNH